MAKVQIELAQTVMKLMQRIAKLEGEANQNAGTIESNFRRIGDELAKIQSSPLWEMDWTR